MNNNGTVFEVSGGGFVPLVRFNGTPGAVNCHGVSVSGLAHEFGGLAHAAVAMGFSSVPVLQNTITVFCAG